MAASSGTKRKAERWIGSICGRGLAVNLWFCKIIPFLCLGVFLVLLIKHDDKALNIYNNARITIFPEDDDAILYQASPAIQKLVEAIRKATYKASDGSPVEFSKEDRARWEAQNPCRSRKQLRPIYAARNHLKDVPANKEWDLVFREYEKFHRTCMQKVGDLADYFVKQNTSTTCKFVIAETHFGLGNKLYHISSVFMFAVLKQRVILVPESTFVPSVVCEPFSGSSWKIGEEFHERVKTKRKASWEFYDAVDQDLDQRGSMDLYVSAMTDSWGPELRFFCDTEQKFLSHVTWLTMDGCLLFLPKLWAIDMFRPTLEALFPHRIAFTYILRSLMLPADHVWDRVLHVRDLYIGSAEKQVGIQLRYFHGTKEFERKNDLVNDRIARCLWENNIVPEVCPSDPNDPRLGEEKFSQCSQKSVQKQNRRLIKVLIASLFQGLQDYLQTIYLRKQVVVPDERIGIYQLTHELEQGSGVEVDSQALVEIISLSFSDVLLVSPMSTFGGAAQAYGGIQPWFIQTGLYGPRPGESDQCQRAMAIDPCHLGARENYECRYDPPGNKNIYETFSYLKNCLYIDIGGGWGMELVPDTPEQHDFSV